MVHEQEEQQHQVDILQDYHDAFTITSARFVHFAHIEEGYDGHDGEQPDHDETFGSACNDHQWEENEHGSVFGDLNHMIKPFFNAWGIFSIWFLFFHCCNFVEIRALVYSLLALSALRLVFVVGPSLAFSLVSLVEGIEFVFVDAHDGWDEEEEDLEEEEHDDTPLDVLGLWHFVF